MNEPETPPPDKRPVLFKSKKQMKEEWAKLDLPDLENTQAPTEDHAHVRFGCSAWRSLCWFESQS